MLSIKDRFYLSVKVEGAELNFNLLSLLSLTITSNLIMYGPSAVLSIADVTGFFNADVFADGQRIDIKTYTNEKDEESSLTYTFRVFKVQQSQWGAGKKYDIHCIFNAPRYLIENYTGAYSNTVSELVKYVADVSGLEHEVDATADFQTWYGLGKRSCCFLRESVSHSYLDNSSCFVLGLTLGGVLKLKNISELDFKTTKVILSQSSKTHDLVKQVINSNENSKSGFYNVIASYRYETVEQSIENTVHSSVDIPVKSSTVNVNKPINEGLLGSIVDFAVDCGNYHPNYVKAKHQNKRIKATFGMGLDIQLAEASEVDVLDTCTYVAFNKGGKALTKYSGGYLVTAKTIYITPGYYFEKLHLQRQGYNLDTVTAETKEIIEAP